MDRRSVSIAGAGKIEGGTYERVKISGSGSVTGDVEADEFKVAGSARVEGRLRAARLEVAGAFKSDGELEVGEGEIAGSLTAGGPIQAQELRISGAAKCGPIRGGYIRINGAAKVAGDVEADFLRIAGVFRVEGLLSADRLEIRLEDSSRARELGGEVIQVRRGTAWGGLLSSLGKLLGTRGRGTLEVELVEGDEVDLEWVRAEVVRGRVVRLGPGCRVGRVEYQESLEVSPEAEVGEEVRG
jgi:cytoskeletal protein CcmA (bactofilin family)